MNQENQQKLSKQQQLDMIKNIHQFLLTYERIPGFIALQWAQMLQSLELVFNNINNEVSNSSSNNETK